MYVPSLHIFVYAHVFAYVQLHYVQDRILAMCLAAIFKLYTCAENSNCADDIQLKSEFLNVHMIKKHWHLEETLIKLCDL